MRLDCDLAIGSKNINGLEDSLVNILNELFNWLLKCVSILVRDGTVVIGWEIDYARCSLCLFLLTIVCVLAFGTGDEQLVELPGLFMFEVVEWR